MREVPPGPERDRLERERERRRRAFEQELAAGPPFPVYGAVSAVLCERMIGGHGRYHGALVDLELRYSRLDDVDRAAVSVRTEVCPPYGGWRGRVPWGRRAELARALQTERFNTTNGDPPDPVIVEDRRARLLVDGVARRADVRVEDEWWAALVSPAPVAEHPSVRVRVLVIARGVPMEQVRLDRVGDFAPYFEADRQWMARMRAMAAAEPRVDPADLDLPEVEGFAAHHALIERAVIPVMEEHRAHRENRRGARRTHDPKGWARDWDPQAWTRDWESATRTQMRLAGQDRTTAKAAVTALVNHMIQLAIRTDWYGTDPQARAAAIEESIRWTVFASEVPSREAQQAWLVTWNAQQAAVDRHFLGPGEHDEAVDDFDDRHEDRWSDAWKAWHSTR